MGDWKNDRAEMEMRNSGKEISKRALIKNAIENGKLPFKDWVNKYFYDQDGHHTNIWEQVEKGMAPSDLSHWHKDDLEEEYMCYIKGIEGDCDPKQWQE